MLEFGLDQRPYRLRQFQASVESGGLLPASYQDLTEGLGIWPMQVEGYQAPLPIGVIAVFTLFQGLGKRFPRQGFTGHPLLLLLADSHNVSLVIQMLHYQTGLSLEQLAQQLSVLLPAAQADGGMGLAGEPGVSQV